MDRYTIAQRIEIVKIHYKSGEMFAITTRKVRTAFGRQQAPSRTAIVKLIEKFERLGQVTDVKVPIRVRKARTTKNIATVTQSVIDNPGMPISQRSKELGLSATTIYRIMYIDLGLPLKKKNKEHDEELHQNNEGLPELGGAVLE